MKIIYLTQMTWGLVISQVHQVLDFISKNVPFYFPFFSFNFPFPFLSIFFHFLSLSPFPYPPSVSAPFLPFLFPLPLPFHFPSPPSLLYSSPSVPFPSPSTFLSIVNLFLLPSCAVIIILTYNYFGASFLESASLTKCLFSSFVACSKF